MKYFYLKHSLPKGNWAVPHVEMYFDDQAKATRQIPSKFIGKPIRTADQVTSFWLTGKRNKNWDMISPSSMIFPQQSLISDRFHQILLDFKLSEIFFGNTDVYSHDKSTRHPYKMINIIRSEDLSVIDLKSSVVMTYNNEKYRYEPVEVGSPKSFVEVKGKLQTPVFKENFISESDLFLVKKIHAWIISEKLADRLKDEKITGLFGFPVSPDARIEANSFYRENQNHFAV